MKRKAITTAVALGFALSTGLAMAQTSPPGTEPAPGAAPAQQEQIQPGLGGLTHAQLSELEGMTVTDAQGEQIGDVSKVVESVQDQRPHAVLSIGGFLGMGDTEVAVPLDELQRVGDELMLTTGDTKEQLEQRAGEYQEQNYREIEAGDRGF